MEDDLNILKVEYLSSHCMHPDIWVIRGILEENSEEISGVALISPACFSYCAVGFLFLSWLFFSSWLVSSSSWLCWRLAPTGSSIGAQWLPSSLPIGLAGHPGWPRCHVWNFSLSFLVWKAAHSTALTQARQPVDLFGKLLLELLGQQLQLGAILNGQLLLTTLITVAAARGVDLLDVCELSVFYWNWEDKDHLKKVIYEIII